MRRVVTAIAQRIDDEHILITSMADLEVKESHVVHTVEDVVKIGDVIDVKVIGIDDQGRIKCSRKASLPQK